MIVIRKIDLIIQGFLFFMAFIALVLSPDYLYYIEAVLGMWQLVSALLNSFAMHHEGNSYRKRIIIYWALSIPALIMLFTFSEMAMMIATIGSWGIAVYYWIIYLLFIQHISYRKELSTVLRSR